MSACFSSSSSPPSPLLPRPTAMMCVCCHDVCAVLHARPSLRSCEVSVVRRTSTAILRGQCGVPDLNRDHVSSVLRAGPQPRSCVRKKICQKECQKICQKECQKICQKECQKICQKICQKECQKICQKECQKICQKKYQKICQKRMSEDMSERMSEDMSERMSKDMAERMS